MSFVDTIRAVEAERMEQAREAVASGWTEADHPAKCCPPEAKTTQPKRTPEQRAQSAREHAVNFEWRAVRLEARLAALSTADGLPNDRAQANIPWSSKRSAAAERAARGAAHRARLERQLDYTQTRATHWRTKEQETTT